MDTREQVIETIDNKLREYWFSLSANSITAPIVSKLSRDEREDLLDYLMGSSRFSSEKVDKLKCLSIKQKMEKHSDRGAKNYQHTPEFFKLRDSIVYKRLSIIREILYSSDIDYSAKMEIANKLEVTFC